MNLLHKNQIFTVCFTNEKGGGKNGRGKECMFPFIYLNISHLKCTTSNSQLDEPWCSTKVDESNRRHIDGDGNWGVCLETCEFEGKS